MNKKNKIEKDIKFLKAYAILSTSIMLFFIFSSFSEKENKQRFDEISVKKINIINDDGKNAIVISNADKSPNPILSGKDLGKRDIKPSGIIFYNNEGSECGGIGVAAAPQGSQTMMIFDYSNSEAIGFGRMENSDKVHYGAAFSIYDKIPKDADMEKVGTVGTERISIQNGDKNAMISISDQNGKPRIVFSVDSLGNAQIQMLDSKGKVTFSEPREK